MIRISTLLAFLFLFLCGCYLSAQTTLGNYVSSQQTANSITVQATNGSVVIEAYTSKMIKVSLVPTGTPNPDTSYSVIAPASYYSTPIFTNNSNSLVFALDSVTVLIQKTPVRLKFIYNADTLLQDENGLFTSGAQSGVTFQLQSQEQIFGSGSRAIDINRRGQTLDLYNTAVGEYGNGTSTLNINIPFITSSNLYGLYFDNYSEGTLDIGNSNSNVLSYTSASGAFSYYFIAGNSYADILNSYTGLTGRQPLPPRWAFGYIQSKYGYQTQQQAKDIVTQMRQAAFPMDAIVLDLYWYGGENLMGNLNWDNNAFPTPQSMMSGFDSMGIKTILIAEPYFTQQSSTYSDANNQHLFATQDNNNNTYIINNFWAGSAALLDIYQPAAQQWMWNFYKARTDEGVGGWWSDLGEPEDHPNNMQHVLGPAQTVHNVYNLFWQQMLYNNYATVYPTKRLFNLSRSGYAGMQRYAATPWSGDVNRSFSGLQAQIPIMLGMGMSGESYIHSDIGGFCCSGEDDELYTRWFEYGTFSPIMRAHGQNAPTEPVNYPTATQNILHVYANLRYQLLPYNYTLAYQNSTTGIPQARQLDFYDPNNTFLSNVSDEFYWGDNFLVAPVIQQGATSRNVIFPAGNWLNYWDNTLFAGNTTANVSAPLNTLPLFVRSGSFIPMAPLEMTTTLYHADTLYVNYYADSLYPVSSFTMYDDDGQTPNANLHNQYALIQFNGNVLSGETDISLAQTGAGYTGMPINRQMTFRVQPTSKVPIQVLKDGVALPVTMSMNDFNNNDSAYYWDQSGQVLYIHFNWNENSSIVRIIYDANSSITNLTENEIKIYPNPVANILTVQSNNCNSISGAFIYDISGRLVMHPTTTGANPCLQNIDVSTLAQGVYLLEMKSGGESFYGKFVKQ